jgi:hypothetical protein
MNKRRQHSWRKNAKEKRYKMRYRIQWTLVYQFLSDVLSKVVIYISEPWKEKWLYVPWRNTSEFLKTISDRFLELEKEGQDSQIYHY